MDGLFCSRPLRFEYLLLYCTNVKLNKWQT
jgi:hypothetical protein